MPNLIKTSTVIRLNKHEYERLKNKFHKLTTRYNVVTTKRIEATDNSWGAEHAMDYALTGLTTDVKLRNKNIAYFRQGADDVFIVTIPNGAICLIVPECFMDDLAEVVAKIAIVGDQETLLNWLPEKIADQYIHDLVKNIEPA